MKATMKHLFALMAAAVATGAALPSFGDDTAIARATSTAGRLDLRTCVRIAGGKEQIAYSPRWGNAANCSIAVDGKEAMPSAADEGYFSWTPSGVGAHMFAYKAGSTEYTAQLTVLGEDAVAVNSGRISSNAVWRADVVWIIDAPLTVPPGVSLTIERGAVVKFMPGSSLTVEPGGVCTASGVVFTHVSDDTVGGDVLCDGDTAIIGGYAIVGTIIDDESTEYRHMAQQMLPRAIESDTKLHGYCTYVVSSWVTVADKATLTISPGAILKFANGAWLTVSRGGTLNAQGTRAAPIVFTSLNDDEHGGDTNGDGDKTRPQPGDWQQIKVYGTATFNYANVLYTSSRENSGAIEASGGTVTFDNSEIAHTTFECVNAHDSGSFTARNSVFRDSSLGFGYYGKERVKAYNCVFADIGSAAAIRQSGKLLVNCIFYKCFTAFTDQGGDGSTFQNCCFYNPPGYGPQEYSKVGSDGNIWGDPLFVDPDNGDFRIAANSPCVDAGDGGQSPRLDYYGKPRMDVKEVEDSGVQNAGGACPDIGIYEVPGSSAEPSPDLAVGNVSLGATGGGALGTVRPGDAITVAYSVTNRGAVAAAGIVRDLFRFAGADDATAGLTVDAGEALQTYSLAAGAGAEFTAAVSVPALKAGAWKVVVVANAQRDIYEAASANNSAESDAGVSVVLDSLSAGESKTIDVAAGGIACLSVAGLPASGGAVVAALPRGVAFYASVGYVPDAERHDVAGTALKDGRLALFIPERAEGDAVFVTIVNDSGSEQTVSLDALASAEGLETARSNDVEVTDKGPKVSARLVLPESVRDGRIYVAWVEYWNSGDEDAELPIFTVSRADGGATLSATAKGAYSADPLPLIGLAPSAPRGKLKSGESGRVAFYILSSEALSLRLEMVTGESTEGLNGFAGIAEYMAGMSAAATRLCARGGAEPGFREVLAQALNERRGAGGCAVYGTLRHSVTHLPLAGVEIHLVATNGQSVAVSGEGLVAAGGESVAAAVRTDAGGCFALAAEGAGDYAVVVRDVLSYTPCIVSLSDGADRQVSVSAVPLASVSGFVGRPDETGVAADAIVVLDDLSTSEQEDYVATTDATGMYSFSGVADGEYRLSLYPSAGYTIVETGAFSVSNGMDVVRNLSYAERGRVVSGAVTDVETGAAVSNVVVMLSRKGMQLGVTTDGNGAFVFDGVATGRWGLSLQASEHQIDGMSELVVQEGDGEQEVRIPARAKCPFAVLRPVGMAPHEAAFAVVRDDVTDLAWDFDGDGVTDSTDRAPKWTYANAGNYTVSLSYRDGDGEVRKSLWTDAVKVVEAFENQLKANGALVSETGGVSVESVSETELVISGAAVAAWTAPGTVLGAENSSKGGFIRRVVSAEDLGGNRWRFKVEEAGLADLFERYFMSSDIAVSADKGKAALKAADYRKAKSVSPSGEEVSRGSKVTVPGRSPDHSISLPTLSYTPMFQSEVSASITGHISSWIGDMVKGSCGAIVMGGAQSSWYSETDTYESTVTASGSYTVDWTEGLTGKKPYKKSWNQSWGSVHLGWGIFLSLQTDEDISFGVMGSGAVNFEQSVKVRRTQLLYFEDGDLKNAITTDWGATLTSKRSYTGSISPTLDAAVTVGLYGSYANFFGRAGGGPKFGAKLSLTQSVELGGQVSVSAGTQGLGFDPEAVADSKLELGFTPYVGINVSWKWINTAKAEKRDTDLPIKVEWPNTASVGNMGIEVSGEGLEVEFRAKNPKINASGYIFKDLLGLDGMEVPAGRFFWYAGDGSLLLEGSPVKHTYEKPGKYKVRLFGLSPIPTSLIAGTGSPFIRKASMSIDVFEDKPPSPRSLEDAGGGREKRSWDPNAVEGPEGVGEERIVGPGDWMTYTVYFENKADADVPAQEVRVTNPLSPWLDWSTFEMLEASFCNQIEMGLVGKQSHTVTTDQEGTPYKVKVSVALDDRNGRVEWYLRSWDPARADYGYWPPDGEGLLPPNDAAHRGEGHLTYRIRVRGDAPSDVVITNSATIVFDTNAPIETDPAWWNTVGVVHEQTLDLGGGLTTNLTLIAGRPFGELPAPAAPDGYSFDAWYTGENGTGTKAAPTAIVPAGAFSLYANWTAVAVPEPVTPTPVAPTPVAPTPVTPDPVTPDPGEQPEPAPEPPPELWAGSAGQDAVRQTAALTYDGYLHDSSGNLKGTIQVKVGKPNAKTKLASVKATVIGLDGKKRNLKAADKGKARIDADGCTTVPLVGGDPCSVTLGLRRMSGSYGGYVIDGSLNVFTSKDASDKAAASAALGKWQGAMNMAWRLAGDGSPYHALSMTIAAKGKAKVSGTLADGAKVAANSQLLVGGDWCCVPVVYVKKGVKLALNVWLPLGGQGAATPVVAGLADAIVGKSGTLKAGATFRLGATLGDARYAEYLPNGVPVTGGAKWKLPKAGKIAIKKGVLDDSKKGENPSALKLTYKAKDGTFKGSFKAYADVKGKLKATTVNVTGVLVDGVGYGAATVKKAGGVPVTISP